MGAVEDTVLGERKVESGEERASRDREIFTVSDRSVQPGSLSASEPVRYTVQARRVEGWLPRQARRNITLYAYRYSGYWKEDARDDRKHGRERIGEDDD